MSLPSDQEICDWISKHLNSNKQHVANVLSGPKRETWFSSDFACYGEQSYKTALNSVGVVQQFCSALGKRPDIVIYKPDVGINAIHAIIEVKVIFEGEMPSKSILDLDNQLRTARSIFPNALVLGIVFISATPLITPGTFQNTKQAIKSNLESTLSSPDYSWINQFDVVDIFTMIPTTFAYPSMMVPLSMGVRKLS
jgi:hypothetical protein